MHILITHMTFFFEVQLHRSSTLTPLGGPYLHEC